MSEKPDHTFKKSRQFNIQLKTCIWSFWPKNDRIVSVSDENKDECCCRKECKAGHSNTMCNSSPMHCRGLIRGYEKAAENDVTKDARRRTRAIGQTFRCESGVCNGKVAAQTVQREPLSHLLQCRTTARRVCLKISVQPDNNSMHVACASRTAHIIAPVRGGSILALHAVQRPGTYCSLLPTWS